MNASPEKKEILWGVLLMGLTGLLIGLAVHSPMLMVVAGVLGSVIGGFVGWLGGHRFMLIVCAGAVVGALLGYSSGDRDILIISAGSGAAISGFLGAQIDLFFGKR
ncbi:MAG: hypothetical protein COV66_06655 [Nitrospinae bacterium CG11_big_fil_rev_8_21_14_0_20_45_15]|nr:MAG: hypothetical protein COV66_06655 [Nitrospinae bacterium CG11_big_fil_rev_8_21_14_0_20_45_15]